MKVIIIDEAINARIAGEAIIGPPGDAHILPDDKYDAILSHLSDTAVSYQTFSDTEMEEMEKEIAIKEKKIAENEAKILKIETNKRGSVKSKVSEKDIENLTKRVETAEEPKPKRKRRTTRKKNG